MDTDAAAGEAEVDLSASEAAAKAAAMNAVQMDMSQVERPRALLCHRHGRRSGEFLLFERLLFFLLCIVQLSLINPLSSPIHSYRPLTNQLQELQLLELAIPPHMAPSWWLKNSNQYGAASNPGGVAGGGGGALYDGFGIDAAAALEVGEAGRQQQQQQQQQRRCRKRRCCCYRCDGGGGGRGGGGGGGSGGGGRSRSGGGGGGGGDGDGGVGGDATLRSGPRSALQRSGPGRGPATRATKVGGMSKAARAAAQESVRPEGLRHLQLRPYNNDWGESVTD